MEYIMETLDLVKSYLRFGNHKAKTVVDRVSIHVKKGEIYGFVGPNGAGKSTVMKMLFHLVPPDSGEVHIFGEKIAENSFECFKRLGSMIENPYFYNKISGRKNLELHCEYMGYHNRERIDEVLGLVQLDRTDEKPVSSYSLGMKQRLAIARAIVTQPEFLVLDEPINALDPEGIREMRRLFRQINQEYGTSIFISSHILSEIEQIADTIGMIRNGTLLQEISMAEIRQRQTDYIVLEVEDVRRAGYLLEHTLFISNFKVSDNTHICIYDFKTPIPKIAEALVKNEIGILSIVPKQTSLEDYFFGMIEEG